MGLCNLKGSLKVPLKRSITDLSGFPVYLEDHGT